MTPRQVGALVADILAHYDIGYVKIPPVTARTPVVRVEYYHGDWREEVLRDANDLDKIAHLRRDH